MNPFFFPFADVHKGGVDARQHVFHGAEINVTDLIAALGHHQFINAVIGEHCGDSQLLGDDDLLRHGRSGDDLQVAGRERKWGEALSACRLADPNRLTSPMQAYGRGSGA